ncbi:hypothetical protein IW261DRAFT_1456995 [Armillaria novae-zelandiae]|uniref:Mid2 domain-containing protein n=1 Tax=Armillaria novae-zelandiae TaxID=153914 RepID=A0AA39PIV3_9AGAR|nr:hypothetical protein IW261DRAFT_1456995 [Armillaria novae-zelandiae]
MAGYHNVSIDNTQISDNLKYLPVVAWTNNGSYHTRTGETGTLSSTKDQTANVTFTFPQAANAFYYYGIPRCCGGMYAICIDCDFDSPNFEPIDGVNRSDDGQNPPIVLYSKTFDTPEVHKVTLSNQKDPRFAGGNSQITLARFVIQVQDDISPVPESSISSMATSSISATSSIAPEASQTSTPSSTTSKPPIGAIVGGVLGGIVAISLCFIIWFFMRRRHRTQPEHNNTNTSFHTSPYQYTPFIIPGPRTNTPTVYTVTDITSDYTPQKTNRTPGASVLNSSSGRTQPSSSRMASSDRLPRRETDAGRIDIGDDDDDLRTLPPEYEDVFSRGQSIGVTRRLSGRLPEPQRPLEGSLFEALGQPPSEQPAKL